MGNYTTNLGLYNTDMNADGNDTFDFQRDLNDNNDKIDSAIGKLSTLTTTDKSSLVNAIIEIVTNLGGKTSKSLDDLNAVGQAIIDKKVEVEALLQQNGYAKFSWKENNVISNLIVQWGYNYVNNGDKITFSLTFNHCFSLLICPYSTDINGFYNYHIYRIDNDGFYPRLRHINNTFPTGYYYYISVGI